MRLFTAGHNHQVSITSCPRYYAHPVGVAVMCEADHGGQTVERVQVHQNVDFYKSHYYYNIPYRHTRRHNIKSAGKWIHLCPFRMSSLFKKKEKKRKMGWLLKTKDVFFFTKRSVPSFERASLGLSCAWGL